jgi:hypothetical protein
MFTRIKTAELFHRAQLDESKQNYKRPVDCCMEGASDVPAAGEIPASPQNSRRSARAAVNETADRPGEPVEGAVDITTAHNLLGGQ